MERDKSKYEELCTFIAKEIALNLKPSTCQSKNINKNSNIKSDAKDWKKSTNHNIINKIINRQIYGEFSVHRGVKNEAPFIEIPDYLKFCLRTEILPTDVAENHIYMGLTACGQFLLSYTEKWFLVEPEENDFRSEKLEYRLYFWGFRPHHPCYIVHSVPLFDEKSLYHYQSVTMVQWKSMPWLLVIHATNDCERNGCINMVCEHISHITWTAVPSLGCSSCKKESTCNKVQKGRSLCAKHKILIHTEYDCGSFEPLFKPHVNMRLPGRIVISTGALMHIMDLQLLTLQSLAMGKSYSTKSLDEESAAGCSREDHDCNISDLFNMFYVDQYKEDKTKQKDKLVSDNIESKNIHKADKAYEFVEETENCEKIEMFRKRRLADRRYEYREDTLADYFGLKWNKYMKLGANTNKVLYETTNANFQRSQNKTLNILNDGDIEQAKSCKSFSDNNSGDPRSGSVIPEYITNSPLSFRRKSSLILEDKDNYKCSLTHIKYFSKKKHKDNSIPDKFYDESSVFIDDQLPSGFHTTLPLSFSSDFQIVSPEDCNNLIKQEPILAITQQSFDLETFSYLVSCKLCEKEKKYFKCLQDWYSEILKVSPVSGITCILLLHVVAIPSLYRRPLSTRRCEQCVTGDCLAHRRDYEASCLFQWDPTTGYYAVISHTPLSLLVPDKDTKKTPQMWRPNRRQATRIIEAIEQDNIGWNMRVQYTLNTELSLESITDWDHFIQLNRGHFIEEEDSTDDWSD